MSVIVQFAIGLVFGLGLVLAGMSDPAKVLNFLDVAALPAGTWDGSLALVMGAAVLVTAVGYRVVLRRARPVFATAFDLPVARGIDARVITGPALFGIGWGLAGFCPGPALTALGTGAPPALIFVAGMLAGMLAARRLADRRLATRLPDTAPT